MASLLWSGLVTMAAIVYLLATTLTRKLSPAAFFYLVFAVGLIPLTS